MSAAKAKSNTAVPMFVPAPTVSAAARAGRRPGGSAFFRDAFRPFYLGGATFAALAIPLWLWMWRSGADSTSIPLLLWHTHEMVFGFGVAIIVGFLFTAARNWTGLPLPAGVPLAILVAMWLGGRAGVLLSYGLPAAAVDSALLVIVAGMLAQRFIRARSVASMPLVGVLGLLSASNIAFHAAMLGWVRLSPLAAVESGLMLIVLVEMIIGGRIIPAFTASGIPGVRQWRPRWLAWCSLGAAAAAFLADALRLPPSVVAAACLTAGALVAVLAVGWNPWASREQPMLWVLHAGYACIPFGLVLLGLAAVGVVPRSAGVHALAVGSMGGLIMGMVTRTALGHTGRPVRAGTREVAAFALVLAAGGVRIIAALVLAIHLAGVVISGVLWSAAFIVYAVCYAPILLGDRASVSPSGSPLGRGAARPDPYAGGC